MSLMLGLIEISNKLKHIRNYKNIRNFCVLCTHITNPKQNFHLDFQLFMSAQTNQSRFLGSCLVHCVLVLLIIIWQQKTNSKFDGQLDNLVVNFKMGIGQ